MTMKGGTVLNTVKNLACMLGGCNIGLQWSINGVLTETFSLVVGSRAEGVWLPNTGMRHNERGNCVGYRKNACMHVGGL